MLKPLTVWITTNCKILKEMGIPDHLTCLWETCMQVRKQQLGPDMEPLAGSKLGKEYIKAVYCHPGYLTYMQSTSCEMPGWMNPKVESRLPGEISITSDWQATPPKGRKQRGTKEPFEGERELTFSAFENWRSWHPVPLPHGRLRPSCGYFSFSGLQAF